MIAMFCTGPRFGIVLTEGYPEPMNYRCASLGVVLTLAGCSIDNPLFGVSSDPTDATGVGSSSGGYSTSVTPTSEPVPSTSVESDGSGSSPTATSVDPQTATSVDPQTSGTSDVSTSGPDSDGSSGAGFDMGVGVGVCGNGITEGGEECDDGNMINGDGCSETCLSDVQAVVCGDGIKDPDEECDEGPQNSNSGACTAQCTLAKCGDGLLQDGVELCDAGKDNSNNGACTLECKKAFCGDGLVHALVETCDAGASNGKILGGCNTECTANISDILLAIKVAPEVITADMNGNLGVAGADNLCQKHFGANYKALVADGFDRVSSVTALTGDGQKDWVLAAHRGYANAKNELVFITGKESLLGVRFKVQVPLLKPIAQAVLAPAWTGINKSWQVSESTCKQWVSVDLDQSGAYGNPLVVDGTFIGVGTKVCTNKLSLYCVQQP